MKNDAGNYQKPTSYYDDYIRLITLLERSGYQYAKEIVWKWNEKTFGDTGKTLMQKRLGLY